MSLAIGALGTFLYDLEEKSGEIRNQGKNRNHLDLSIVEIG